MGTVSLSFNQSCPICGRKLLVPIEYLGMTVQCSHCKGDFLGQDTSNSHWKDELRISLERRADALLAMHRAAALAR